MKDISRNQLSLTNDKQKPLAIYEGIGYIGS